MKTVNTNRRDLLAGGGLALLGAGFLSRVDKVAAQQRPLSLTEQVKKQAGGPSEKLFVNAAPDAEGPPTPATYDRLPLEWNKQTVRRFKEKLAERDIEAFVVREPLNTIYLTGYWHTTTERPEATFRNKDDADPCQGCPAALGQHGVEFLDHQSGQYLPGQRGRGVRLDRFLVRLPGERYW
jgi:hypothetical protein